MEKLAGEVATRASAVGAKGRTVTLKLLRAVADQPAGSAKGGIGHGVCDHLTRSVTLLRAANDEATIAREATRMLADLDVPALEVRGAGVTLSRLEGAANAGGGVTRGFKSAPAGPRSTYVERGEVPRGGRGAGRRGRRRARRRQRKNDEPRRGETRVRRGDQSARGDTSRRLSLGDEAPPRPRISLTRRRTTPSAKTSASPRMRSRTKNESDPDAIAANVRSGSLGVRRRRSRERRALAFANWCGVCAGLCSRCRRYSGDAEAGAHEPRGGGV